MWLEYRAFMRYYNETENHGFHIFLLLGDGSKVMAKEY
jgi:hypothetical protein